MNKWTTMKKRLTLLIIFISFFFSSYAKQYKLDKNISYIEPSETNSYRKERCKLDIYYPTDKKDFPTIIWFHGGGLEGGEKDIPKELQEQGIAVVSVNYRLSPKATHPAYIEDAAEAVAWTFRHIQKYGGNTHKIYLSGHSAGGYLTLMVTLDANYLAKHNINANTIKGAIPIAGQTNTHYTIRKERNIPTEIPIIDQYAPLNQARKDVPPMVLITGDRKLEMTARYEENAHLEAILKSLGAQVSLYEIKGFNHGNVVAPGCLLALEFIRKIGDL